MNGERPVLAAKVRVPRVTAFNRVRLNEALSTLVDSRIVLVVAPAGSGKTTLLAQLAGSEGPSAWYSLDNADGDPSTFLRHLEVSLAVAVDAGSRGWESEADAVSSLEASDGPPLYLFLDDLHTIAGTPAEAMLERFLRYAPPRLTTVMASRSAPGFDLSRVRLSGSLAELSADDLRFRSWEVERLFRDFYAEPLPPEAVAELCRRTEGWAAGIQLFHLATSGKSLRDRRQVLTSFAHRSRLIREYLAGNVLASLHRDLRQFLLDTCVLERLSGALCDRLRGSTGSEALLRELEQRQIFTSSVDDLGNYRYHEVLRAYLESSLVEIVGEEELCRRYLRAAALLESEGALPEALRAYSRGGDKDAVARLLGRGGEELTLEPGSWLDILPTSIRRSDPWLLLASARQHRAAGRFTRAMADYREAEKAFGSAAVAQTARGERLAVASWFDPLARSASDWSGMVRTAAIRDPDAVRRRTTGSMEPTEILAGGIASLLSGRVRDARTLLMQVCNDEHASETLIVGARLAAAIARLLAGDRTGRLEAARASDEGERLGLLWLARMGRAALALGPEASGPSEAAAVRMACEQRDDAWGAALAALIQGWGALGRGETAGPALEDAAGGFRRVGAGVLEAWARAGLALARAREGHPDARLAALQAEAGARLQSVPAAQAVAYLALAELEPERAAEYRSLAATIEGECGISLPGPVDRTKEASVEPAVTITTFGGFNMTIAGRSLDLNEVRPRARQALRLLALHSGHPLHREVLVEALWPEVDLGIGTRNLQVAISSLRHAFELHGANGNGPSIVRDADAYVLTLPAASEVDVDAFARAVLEGATAKAMGDGPRAVACYARALELYNGDLLPEEGPSEWIVREREHRRSDAADAAQTLAETLMELGDAAGAARACEAGLRIDRYRDELWQLAISAHERTGTFAAAAQTRRRYSELLTELGLEPANAYGVDASA